MKAGEIMAEVTLLALERFEKLFLQVPCKNDRPLHSNHLINVNLYYYHYYLLNDTETKDAPAK